MVMAAQTGRKRRVQNKALAECCRRNIKTSAVNIRDVI
jgi:hypothetical protein